MTAAAPPVAAIAITGLTHRYPGGRRQPPRTALDDLNLAIPPGAFFVLTGPNGSGKSTLFKILCGLARPSTGAIAIEGHDLFAQPVEARSRMGVVFQKPALDKHLTVRENLKIHADLYDIPKARFRQRLEEGLPWSDLADRLDDRVETLSGGLARQVELVKVLLHDPSILILDEPTAGLDPGGRNAFITTLHRLQRARGVTILMTSHIFSEAEAASDMAILRQGRLLVMESPTRLKGLLGRELLLIEGDSLEAIEADLARRPGITVQRQSKTLRIQGEELMGWMPELLTTHREAIRAIAVRQPDLEDVYIHLTGRALAEEESLP